MSLRATRAVGEVPSPLFDLRGGLERETHRICPDGALSEAPHPVALRSPAFTRDFAESQLEIVTRPRATVRQVVAELRRLTAVAQRAVGPELLWPFSMPPPLPAGSPVSIARLGTDEPGRRAVATNPSSCPPSSWSRRRCAAATA